MQHDTRNTTITKMRCRKQELPIMTSPGPSLPLGHFNLIFSAPVNQKSVVYKDLLYSKTIIFKYKHGLINNSEHIYLRNMKEWLSFHCLMKRLLGVMWIECRLKLERTEAQKLLHL